MKPIKQVCTGVGLCLVALIGSAQPVSNTWEGWSYLGQTHEMVVLVDEKTLTPTPNGHQVQLKSLFSNNPKLLQTQFTPLEWRQHRAVWLTHFNATHGEVIDVRATVRTEECQQGQGTLVLQTHQEIVQEAFDLQSSTPSMATLVSTYLCAQV